jgi:tetratricopeptide (TPR) repeat protein
MTMKRKYRILFFLLPLLTLPAWGQKEVRDLTRSGNKSYRSQDYSKAEIDYRKALEQSKSDPTATFDLANVLYRTDRGEEAGQLYQSLAQRMTLLSPDQAADVAHNAGNTAFKAKQLEQAIEYYKESLRRRPGDDETRYNLALAQKLLEQQQGGGGQDQNKDQEQDQQKDQQDQQQDQKQDQQNDQQQQQQPQQPKEDQMSQQTAERILKALQNDEQETRRKLEQAKEKGKSRRKNW